MTTFYNRNWITWRMIKTHFTVYTLRKLNFDNNFDKRLQEAKKLSQKPGYVDHATGLNFGRKFTVI